MNDLAQRLAQTNVFQCLPPKECAALAEAAVPRRLRSGEFLCHQDDLWPKVVFISSGQLRWAILSMSGREHVLFTLEPDSLFWGHSIFDDEPMPASLNAMKNSMVYIWPRDIILPFLYRNPKAMWEVTKIQVRTMRRAREIIYGLAFKPVAGRLAKLLLERSTGAEQKTFQRDLTLSEIASMVASSQEVVCRVLYQFQADGLLEINRASITLQDPQALEELLETD